jgi:hypothetical protein
VTGNRAEAERVLADAERRGYLTPGTADDQLLYAALVSDRARARKVYPVALKEPSGGKASERKRALDAMLALAEGRPADAFELMDPPSMNQSQAQQTLLWTIAGLQAKRPADAIRGLDFLTSSPSKLGLDALVPWLIVERGRTLVAQGRVEDGRAAYQRFLDLWKDADADVPLLVQARAEFDKLGT